MDLVVDDPEGLTALATELASSARLAVDSEGDGFHRYRSKLCVLQIATSGLEAIVDTLAVDDLTPIAGLLEAPDTVKILHDVAFDAKMLGQRGVRIDGVFDTSVAARFLSEKSTGLAALLEKYLEVKLDKGFQQADWGERPIPEDRFGYLLDDVRYLEALAEHLEARAREAGILEEIDVETRYAIDRALEPEGPGRPPWSRVKGHRDLKGPRLALLGALAAVREEEAEARDVPPFRVAPNQALAEAARRGAKTVRDLTRVRGLRRLSQDALADALERAEREGPPDTAGPPPPPPEVRARTKAREKALLAWRSEEAERRAVDVQVVLPGHCLRDLASTNEPEELSRLAGFGDKRHRLYAEVLTTVLSAAE